MIRLAFQLRIHRSKGVVSLGDIWKIPAQLGIKVLSLPNSHPLWPSDHNWVTKSAQKSRVHVLKGSFPIYLGSKLQNISTTYHIQPQKTTTGPASDLLLRRRCFNLLFAGFRWSSFFWLKEVSLSHSIGLAVASIHTNHDRDKTKTGRGPLEGKVTVFVLGCVEGHHSHPMVCVHAIGRLEFESKNLVRQGATLHPPVTKPVLPDPAFLPIFGLRPLLISV